MKPDALDDTLDSLITQRRRIDRLDGTIAALLAERMRIALAVGRLKQARDEPIRSAAREAEVLARARGNAATPLSPHSAERIFRAIIDETAACQQNDERRLEALTSVYQGEPGAFSEQAARRLLGPAAPLRGLPTLDAVRDALQNGIAQYAIVPVWNSIAGEVPGAGAILRLPGARNEARISLPIVQCLVAPAGTVLADVRRVVSHPMAIAQCRRFLDAQPWRVDPHDDTAGALRMIVESAARDAAAIAGEQAAQVWGGVVLERGIQDRPDNCTTFVLVGMAAPCRVSVTTASDCAGNASAEGPWQGTDLAGSC